MYGWWLEKGIGEVSCDSRRQRWCQCVALASCRITRSLAGPEERGLSSERVQKAVGVVTAREDFATSLFALYIRVRLGFSDLPFSYTVQGARPLVEHHTAHTHTSEDDERVHGRHHTCATNGWNLTFSVQNLSGGLRQKYRPCAAREHDGTHLTARTSAQYSYIARSRQDRRGAGAIADAR